MNAIVQAAPITFNLIANHPDATVFKATRGFLFLPATHENAGNYWSSTEVDIANAYYFWIYSDGDHRINHGPRDVARPFTAF